MLLANYWFIKKFISILTNIFVYGGIGSIIRDNIGLIIVLFAFIGGSFALAKMARRATPAQGNVPFSVGKMAVITILTMFIFVVLFAAFSDIKEYKKSSHELRTAIRSTDIV